MRWYLRMGDNINEERTGSFTHYLILVRIYLCRQEIFHSGYLVLETRSLVYNNTLMSRSKRGGEYSEPIGEVRQRERERERDL